MRVVNLKINNFKSFLQSTEIKLSSGFNIIVGQNNVGKTAFVQALSLQFQNSPHRSLKTVPYKGATIGSSTKVDISFELNKEEFLELLIDKMPTFYVPNPAPGTPAQKFLDAISDNNIIKCSFNGNQFTEAYLEAFGNFTGKGEAREFKITRDNKQPIATSGVVGMNIDYLSTFAGLLAGILRERIYFFNAERLNIDESNMGNNTNLSTDASNLAQVLNNLQTSNPARFENFNCLVNVIFPQIKQITVPPVSGNRARILTWTIDPESQRDDLAISLRESGTGIGQVLAMLYVVLTSEFPRTIIIDEPASFLHPGAIRKLFDILKQYPQHQYIIATHSPTVVTSVDSQTLFLVRKEDAESSIEIIDVAETQELQLFLSEIGARLSDVFGADGILWVEGRTEELCFPLILSKISKRSLSGIAIIGVIQTGDFEGKYSKTIFEIYQNLSKGRGLLPPAIGFIFDQEGRSEKDCEDLKRKSKGTVFFTPRRMYENYLLNTHAIASVMSKINGFRDKPVTNEELTNWFNQNKWDKKYFSVSISEDKRKEEIWLKKVHGAKILKDIFEEFSENRFHYDKVEHGKKLTDWIIENVPTELEEIASLIKEALLNKKM